MRPGRATSAMKCVARGCAVFLLLAVLAGSGDGRETSFWVTERDADFRSGAPEHVSIKRPGVVLLAPELDTLFSSEENYFWCLAADRSGAVYAGSGDGGRVYRVRTGGRAETVMDSLDLEVLTLAVDKRGSLYAGTAPRGLIWKYDGGKSSVFFETGETYVWCLAFDDDGNLYAGTGDGGKVYKVRPDGKGEVFYDTGERHVMSAQYAQGRLVVGTEGTGLVFAISPDGTGRVLYDCDEQEVRDVACVDGGLTYAAAIARTKSVAGPAPEAGGPGGDQEERKQASSVYRIAADGTGSKLWTSSRTTVYSLWGASGDSVLMGTGDEGRILSLSQGQVELVDRVADSQVLDMTETDGRLVFCTGNKARVFSSGPGASRSGTLISKSFDTNGLSRWGGLSWEADVPRGASLKLQLRSGNSETPNKTWSDWSKEAAANGSVPEAPPARFVQWKATLESERGTSRPALKKVNLAFAEKNLAPVVASVTVLPQGVRFTEGGIDRMPERVSQTLPGGIKVEYSAVKDEVARVMEEAAWARMARTAVWDASDPNSDKLKFAVHYRRPEESKWKLIDDKVDEPVFSWNTSAWPDGTYILRVVTTDLPDNLPSEALSAEALSLPFDVDNTPPVVSRLKSETTARGTIVSGALSDAMSAVTELYYSLDAGEWEMAQSSDGLLDSHAEDFSIPLGSLEAGEHTFGVRALDSAGNVGTASLLIR